jgi:hypothetical protein
MKNLLIVALLAVQTFGGLPAGPPLPPLPKVWMRLESPKGREGRTSSRTVRVLTAAPMDTPPGQVDPAAVLSIERMGDWLRLKATVPGPGWRLEAAGELGQWHEVGELEYIDCLGVTTNEMVVPLWTVSAAWPAGNLTNSQWASWPAGGWTNAPAPRQWFRLRKAE